MRLHPTPHRPTLLVATLLLALLAPAGHAATPARATTSPATPGDQARWRVAWASAQSGGVLVSQWSAHPTTDGARSPADATYRLVVRPTVSGAAVRIRLSNSAAEPLRVQRATVGARQGTEGADVQEGTLSALTFGGRRSAVVAPGTSLRSDPVALPVRALRDLLVSLHVPTPTPLAVHAQSYVTQYVTPAGAGDRTGDASGAAFTDEQEPLPWLDAVEVLTGAQRAVVAIGDSITDGDQALPPFNDDALMDRYERWPDVVARRIAADPEGADAAFVNQGVNGDSAQGVLDRLQRDVLDLAGVTDVVVAVGTNDLTGGATPEQVTGTLTEIAHRLRAGGLRVVGATLVPRGPLADADKAAVNRFIRTSDAFDAVFDMERVLSRSGRPDVLRQSFDSGDGLHPTPTGYQVLGEAFDLSSLRSPAGRCAGRCTSGRVDPTDPRVRFEGRWAVRPGRATTVNSGSRATLRFRGTTVSARFDRAGITAPPEVYVYVDGEKTDRVVVDRDVVRLTRDDLPPGQHTLVLAVKDVQEKANRWEPPFASAVQLTGFVLGPGTVLDQPPAAPDRRFSFLGDSITQGVNLHCPTTESECADGTLAYPWLVAGTFGAQLEQVGFGGQGVTTGGGGGVPPAQDAVDLDHAGSPAAPFDADVVVVNQTTNDASAPSEQVRSGYVELLRAVRGRYPRATIVALEPLGLGGAASLTSPEVEAAVAEVDDQRAVFVTTRGWLGPQHFTEELHPNAAGHREVARRLVRQISGLTGLSPAAAEALPPAAAPRPTVAPVRQPEQRLPATGGVPAALALGLLAGAALLARRRT